MNVLITDDHPLVRKGLIQVLSLDEETKEVYEASNVKEAIDILQKFRPELSIIDLKLGKEDGLEIVDKAHKRNSTSKFIILTSSSRREDFERAQKMGVDGYVLKEAFLEDILYAMHVVLRGKKFVDPELMHHPSDALDKKLELLTEREKEVLFELGKGKSNQMIAKQLYISEHTVKKHISSILSKLEMNHRTEAALFYNRIHS